MDLWLRRTPTCSRPSRRPATCRRESPCWHPKGHQPAHGPDLGQWVALLRPEYAPKDPADRLSYKPGDQAQCDLRFPPARIPVGGDQTCSPPVLVVVASISRCITARMEPSRTTTDLLAGIWSLLAEQLGAVPRRLFGTTRPASARLVRVGARRRGGAGAA